jgi:hypothetical protein
MFRWLFVFVVLAQLQIQKRMIYPNIHMVYQMNIDIDVSCFLTLDEITRV